jgi:hypothetical protein
VAPSLWGPLEIASLNPFALFYLKTEAAPVSETLFLKKKHWTMDKVLKQDSSKCITPASEPFTIDLNHLAHFVKVLGARALILSMNKYRDKEATVNYSAGCTNRNII